MPIKAKQYCSICGKIATKGAYCDLHAPKREYKKENDRRANDYDKWERSGMWRKMRAMHLRIEPLCRACLRLGYTVQATEVDHIIPHKGNWELFCDTNNLQSLCKTCHSIKTGQERRKRN